MCTVSIVPHATGYRLFCNRDERRSRPPALAPRREALGDRTAVFPRDPAGGGTWIGINDADLVVALLNRTLPPDEAPPVAQTVNGRGPSRGLIVTSLLSHESMTGVLDTCAAMKVAVFAPFRLVCVDGRQVASVTSDGTCASVELSVLDAPRLFTSSSLGDQLVDPPRRRLFERMVLQSARPLDGQARFHRHRWRARPQLSVCMSRADAMTVSRSSVDVTRDSRRFTYDGLDGREPRVIEWSSCR